jgi:hypothetical protein
MAMSPLCTSIAVFCFCFAAAMAAQTTTLPEAPSAVLMADAEPVNVSPTLEAVSSSAHVFDSVDSALEAQQPPQQGKTDSHGEPIKSSTPVDAEGNPIPLNRQQPTRILGFMPNFRSVSAGSKPPPPGWKYNFTVARHQAFDYSSFIFLGLTTLSAEGLNEHPSLGKGVSGFYGYGWRGFLDKTDGNFLSAWFLPSLLHEDTRFYPLGDGHSIVIRELYVISRQGVARTYGGRQTPSIAGLGGEILTQVISRTYYPTGSSNFDVLAEKFGYSVMRDVIFSNIREFYPDLAAHYVKKYHEKKARQAAAQAAKDSTPATAKP